MKYPIDAEKYIAAMRLEFGPNKAAEEAHREIIPVVNLCYMDGLHGKGGPLDLEAHLQELSEKLGKPAEELRKNPLLEPLINWCNLAYLDGRREAAEHEDSP